MKLNITIKQEHPAAKAPTYATAGAACFDFYSVDHVPTIVSTNAIFRTGLSFEIPEGYVMLIFSRSGHGFKSDTRLANCVGVIDSDYRGEVMVKLTRDDACKAAIEVCPGDRIAQGMVVPVDRVAFSFADALSDTGRAAGGFGSTGK